MSRKKKNIENPETHQELKGFDIKINEFGEITSSFSVERLNQFLNHNVEDKKLKGQHDPNKTDEEDTTEE